jgi:hypothetical protein
LRAPGCLDLDVFGFLNFYLSNYGLPVVLEREDFEGFGIWIRFLLSSMALSILGLMINVWLWVTLLLIMRDLFVGEDFYCLMLVPPTGGAAYYLDYPGFLRAFIAL